MVLGLHTWGSALPLHPHLHCLITAGGMTPEGRWRASRAHFLLWAPILRTGFHMVRAYGLYASPAHAARERCRVQLCPGWQQPPPAAPQLASDAARCPRCGAALVTRVLREPPPVLRPAEKPTGPGPPLLGMFN